MPNSVIPNRTCPAPSQESGAFCCVLAPRIGGLQRAILIVRQQLHEQPAYAALAHLGEGDFLRAGPSDARTQSPATAAGSFRSGGHEAI